MDVHLEPTPAQLIANHRDTSPATVPSMPAPDTGFTIATIDMAKNEQAALWGRILYFNISGMLKIQIRPQRNVVRIIVECEFSID